MKGRVWVLIVLFILIAVIGGYVGLFKGLNVNERVRLLLVDTLSSALNAEVTAESVLILPWSIRINDVHIIPQTSSVRLRIPRLRIGFNPYTLWMNRDRPLYGAREVYFDRPEITWVLDAALDTPAMPDTTINTPSDTLGISFDKLPSSRITISGGSLVFTRGDSTLVFASRVSGWLDGHRASDIDLNVEGYVLSETKNMTCRGSIDILNNLITGDFASHDINLAFPGIELLTGDLDPESGTLDLSVHAERNADSLSIDGKYDIRNGAVVLSGSNVRISDMALSGILNEREVLLNNVTGTVWGVTSSVSGSVSLLPEPAVNLALKSPGVDIERVLDDIAPGHENYPEGTLDLSATLQGPITDMRTNVVVMLDSLRHKDQIAHDILLDMSYRGNEIACNRLEVVYDGWRVTGEGRGRNVAGNGTKDVTFTFDARRKDDPDSRISVDLSGKANPRTAAYYADLEVDSSYLPNKIEGQFSYGKRTIEIALSDDNFKLDAILSGLGENPRAETTLTLSECLVLHYAGDKDAELILDGTVRMSGTVDSLGFTTDVRVGWGKNLHTVVLGSGQAEDVLSSSRRVQGFAELKDFSLRYAHPESWQINARLDSLGVATLLSDRKGSSLALSLSPRTEEISGTLNLNEFPLEWIVDIFVREEFSHRGKISGIARVDGTLSKPVFRTPEPFHVTDMTLAGIHRLEGAARVSGSRSGLTFSDINISRDDIHILHGKGVWESGSPFNLDVSGKDVELGAIADVISSTRRTEGRTNYDLALSFTRRSGTIEGKFKVEDGYFYDIPFDKTAANMSGGSAGFSVTDFEIEKDGVYVGTGEASSGYFWRNTIGERGLKMNLDLKGDLVRALPSLTGALKEANGVCSAQLSFGGTWQDPVLFDGRMTIRDGTIRPSFLIDEVTDIDAELVIDPSTKTTSGFLAAIVTRGTGIVNGKQLIVENIYPGSPEWKEVAHPGLKSIPNERANLDFGILRGRISRGETRDSYLKLHVPGFMREGETGIFQLGGLKGNWFVVGASETGDGLSPYIAGSVSVLSGDINYPLLESEEEEVAASEEPPVKTPEESSAPVPDLEQRPSFLEDIYWDVVVNSGSNVNYVNEYNLELGGFAGTTLWRNDIKIDENSSFHVTGRLADESLRVTGNARSTYGEVTYYGYTFDIEWAELELDTANILKPAILTGRARTSVLDDSTGVEDEIFLHVNFIDRESGRVTEARGSLMSIEDDYYEPYRPQTRFDAGALGMLEIRFTSNNPSLNTQSRILARLGISVGKIGAAATRAITTGIDNYYFNPLLRPFEEQIKRFTHLDMVRITPAFLGNFAQYQLGYDRSYYPSTNHILFDRSRITFGEYFLRDWFVSYTGQYGVGRDYLSRTEKGFYHDVGLQYLIDRNIRLQLKWNYDEIIKEDDTRIQLRYDFGFD